MKRALLAVFSLSLLAAACANRSAATASAAPSPEPTLDWPVPTPTRAMRKINPLPVEPGVTTGRITVNARPWAYVHVDGKLVGETPIRLMLLASGEHVLRFVNEGMRVELERRVTIAPGQVRNLMVDFKTKTITVDGEEAPEGR